MSFATVHDMSMICSACYMAGHVTLLKKGRTALCPSCLDELSEVTAQADEDALGNAIAAARASRPKGPIYRLVPHPAPTTPGEGA